MSVNNEREKDLIQLICDICDKFGTISSSIRYGINNITLELFNLENGTRIRTHINRDVLRAYSKQAYKQRKNAIKLDVVDKLIRRLK